MKDITKSNEDYLECILNLENNGATKSIDVAYDLNVSKAAVSIAMNDLQAKGFIKKESYGEIILTSLGRDIAQSIYKKHTLVKNFLLGIGVNSDIAEEECCKIEHILSDETLACLKKFCDKNNF